MTDTPTKSTDSSRRNFIKIGAGVVAGAVVAGGAEYIYFSGVNSNNNSKITQLQSDNANLQTQLTAAQNQATGLQSQLTAAQSQATSLQSQLTTETNNYNSAQTQITNLQSMITANNTQISQLQSQISSNNTQISQLQGQLTTAQSQATSLQGQVTSLGGQDALITLGTQEAAVVEAAAEAIIPTDSNGPGAKEAGVIYFIDRQLFGDYGNNGRMYNHGPFIMPNTPGPLTVATLSGSSITYSAGTATTPWASGQTYGYSMSLRNFWHYGIAALETYANTAYGGNFESLTSANQVKCLQDLFNNKPTSFNSIIPSDFANELFFMVWSGFLMDPMYGGNRGMVGWTLTASPGLNSGNFYGEGQTPQQRMVSATPSLLKPVSLAQFQQQAGVAGVQGGT